MLTEFVLFLLWCTHRIALGRIILTLPTAYFGERMASIGFLILAMSGLTVLWRIKDVGGDMAAVVVIGFCLGPGPSRLHCSPCIDLD